MVYDQELNTSMNLENPVCRFEGGSDEVENVFQKKATRISSLLKSIMAHGQSWRRLVTTLGGACGDRKDAIGL